MATRATPATVEDSTVVLFLHGGSYAHYSPKDPWYASLTSRIAHSTRRVVVSPSYRLAPAHPFPAALDDAPAATDGNGAAAADEARAAAEATDGVNDAAHAQRAVISRDAPAEDFRFSFG